MSEALVRTVMKEEKTFEFNMDFNQHSFTG
jgi:hypothetical protein